MARYIAVERGNKESKYKMLEKAAWSLRQGISIMMFPEGTRSTDQQIGPFKLGAFQLALMTARPIQPVLIDGTGGILPKHEMIFRNRKLLRLRVLDPVFPGSFGTDDPEILAEKFRNLMIDELNKMRAEKLS